MSPEAQQPTRPAPLSIVIPSFNSGSTIAKAINSVLDQGYPNVEVIVKDGGSLDGTVEVLQSFGSAIRFESTPDTGQTQALNRAIQISSGQIIGWLNADDFYSPGAFRHLFEATNRDGGADVYYGDFRIVRENGDVLRQYSVSAWDPNRFYRNGSYVWSGAMFFRRSVFEIYGLLDETFHYSMDGEYYFRICENVNAVHIPHILGNFRMSTQNKSGSKNYRGFGEQIRIARMYPGDTPIRKFWVTRRLCKSLLYRISRPVWHSSLYSRYRRHKSL